MARTVMTYNRPTLKVADTEAGLATGEAFECQVTSAVINASVSFQTIPATGCSGPSQSPSNPAYELVVGWLQDWNTPGGGLSGWAEAHAGQAMWVELVPDSADTATKATGQYFIAPGSFGGTFGDGSSGTSQATWPAVDRPTFATPAETPLEAEADTELELV